MPDFFSAIQFIAEQRIQEAQEKGELSNLPGEGRPLRLEDLSYVPEDLRMACKILKNAGFAPEEALRRKEIASLVDLLDDCPCEQERVAAMRRLELLLQRLPLGQSRHAALEANDEYYQAALSKLAKCR